MKRDIRGVVGMAAAVALLAACSGAATNAPATSAPTTIPATLGATQSPPSSAPASNATGATIEAKEVGSAGMILVASSNGMTLYNFSKDTKDSGTSACTGSCLATWPALTVAAGASPVAGDGVTGKLGTITRTDDSSIQVTYNGLPLYFFKNDKAPGDLNGVYENWVTVAP
jgi:predicted lipoprotein with Yx(FWY)xxD motif